MKIELIEIQALARAKRIENIYYSSRTLWWTHSIDDLKEATRIGRAFTELAFAEMLKSDKLNNGQKKMMTDLHKQTKESKIPLDPFGAPLYMITNPIHIEQWLIDAETKPDHFGKYGTEAFMKTHHRNADKVMFTKWEQVTAYLDGYYDVLGGKIPDPPSPAIKPTQKSIKLKGTDPNAFRGTNFTPPKKKRR